MPLTPGEDDKRLVSSTSICRLSRDEMGQAALVHRAAFGERVPWLAGLHTPSEDRAYFRDQVFPWCDVWGAVDGGLIGFIAFRNGWIDQFYVLPARQRRGVGEALLEVAKTAHSELHLWTFQWNAPARRFYENRGFIALEEGDGSGNEEREPDILYRWQRPAC
jgi:putative acetyltransferase